MKRLIARVLPLALLLGCGACSSDAPPPPPPAPTTTPSTTPTSPPASSGPIAVLRDPHAQLLEATAVRHHGRLLVTAAWRAGHHRAIISSDDRFATVSYRHWTPARSVAAFGMPVDAEPGVLLGLLEQPVATVGGTGEAMIGGGDGATLLPFEATARLEGSRWRRYEVTQTSDEMAYAGGAVVLPDGRLLVLLRTWSGDRRHRPSPRYHGLWISEGEDWGSFAPYRPRFVPSLPAARGRLSPLVALSGTSGRSGVVSLRTEDAFYVSRDGRVFRQQPTRPLW